MQQGMLFHSLYAPNSGVYVEQYSFALQGDLDIDAFAAAWNALVARHGVLRTAFAWSDLEEPLQAVYKRVTLPIEEKDWRNLESDEQDGQLDAFLEEDQRLGFDLKQAPLMRLALVRLAEDTWQVVWTHHHLLFDGWCMPLLLKELLALYEAQRRGATAKLGPVRPFRDYIAWLQQRDQSKAQQFWQSALSGLDSPTTIEVAASDSNANEPGEVRLELSEEVMASLGDLSRRDQVTLSTLVQGAWALLLHRYCRSDDVVFGATVSGRPTGLRGAQEMIGLFINTLPVRVSVHSNLSVGEWLTELQMRNAEAREYEYTPLTDIHRWSEFPGGTSLFDHIIVFENYPVERATQNDTTRTFQFKSMKSVAKTNYPLTIVAAPGDRFVLRALHDGVRWNDRTAARLLGHLASILTGFAEDPRQTLAEVPMLSESERAFAGSHEQGDVQYFQDTCVHERFQQLSSEQPDAVALVHEGQHLTYGALNGEANRLARYLRDSGVGPDAIVGICIERSPQMLVGILAVLKSGAAYLPLDPSYPKDRIAYMLEDSGVGLVLHDSGSNEVLDDCSAQQVCIDELQEQLATESGKNLACTTACENLAYVIYTSGSTGRPKGTMLHHRGLLNLAMLQQQAFDVAPRDRVLQFAALSFDASAWEIVMALLNGAALVLSDREKLTGLQLRDTLIEEQVSIVTLPPSVLAVLPSHDLPSLRTLVTAGEACTSELVNQWGKERRYFNAYGPTETTVCASMHLCQPGVSKAPPIGQANPNFETYVLDEQLRRVPQGVPGELCVAGVGLMRGYLGRPGLTADRLVPNPFSDHTPSQLYRTGDLVQVLDDGNIEYLGRIDQQVKIRGFRIELGEIETTICQHPNVSDSVVLAEAYDVNGHADSRIVAYVVVDDPSAVVDSQLLDFVGERLPNYMLPAALVKIEAFPLTPSGKVDRAALARIERTSTTDGVVPTANATEELLAGMFSEILGVEGIGRESNFFELGGHSLQATRLATKIELAFGFEIAVRTIFDNPVIAQLANEIRGSRLGHDGAHRPISPANRDKPLPLSFGQQRLWFVDTVAGENGAYNIPISIRLRGPVKHEALEQALNAIVARHEILRTRFDLEHGEPVQVVTDEQTVRIERRDLSGFDEGKQHGVARHAAADFVHRRFDLTQAPLVRATLLKLDTNDHVLLIVMHHIISDGWSMGILMDEFVEFYQDCTEGVAPSRSRPALQYADYAVWQRNEWSGEVLSSQLEYWKKTLDGVPPLLELPYDRPRGSVQTFRGADHSIGIPDEVASRLAVLCRQENATQFMTLLAAFQVLLYRYSGQTDIVVGTPVANRQRAETQQMIGFFVNTVALRSDLSNSPTFRDLLKAVRARTLDAYDHQDLPFEQLVDALEVERDTRIPPVFQVVFSLQRAGDMQSSSELSMERFEFGSSTSKFDLTLFVTESPTGLSATFEYNTDLFDAVTIERVATHFLQLLDSIIEAPDTSVDELAIIDRDESQRLLAIGGQTKTSYARDATIHELFSQVVAAAPDAIALSLADQHVTYRELHHRSNLVANYLRERGVKPETLVGLCMDRSLNVPVCILGILKAGGAYLPLDPEYPAERLHYIVNDAQVDIVVGQQSNIGKISQSDVDVIAIDSEWDQISQAECQHFPRVDSDNLAYVIYTSGSTGKPKGTSVSHRNVVRLVQNTNFAELGPDEVWLQFAPISFDASTLELWGALLNGSRLAIAEPGRVSLEELAQTIEQQSITSLWLTAGLFHLMVEQCVTSLANVKQLLAGGDVLSTTHARQFLAACPNATLINGYGPTENTTFTSCFSMTTPSPIAASVPIGCAIANTQVYVLDPAGNPAPVGSPGELFAGGDGVARGYFRRPALTAERFVPSPTASEAGDRCFATGDAVRWQSDGNLVFLGRRDEQVKIRGFRIELGEINNTLQAHAHIIDTITVAREDGRDGKHLVSYYVSREEPSPSEEELRGFLRAQLPDYMVPSFFVPMEALPLGPNGKVDRQALPKPSGSRDDRSRFVEASSSTERTLAGLFQNVLQIDSVSITDNFFELGGDSIKSLRVIAMAAEEGLQFSVTDFFQNPTVAALAECARATTGDSVDLIVPGDEVPLTPIQHWFFEEHPPNPHHWNWSLLYEVTGHSAVEPQTIAVAVRELESHHESLRLRFLRTQGEWKQTYCDSSEGDPVVEVDLTALSIDETPDAIESIAEIAQKSLDLAHGPLLRLIYFRCGGDTPDRLLIVLHHLVVDGVSARTLLEDFLKVVGQLSDGKAVQLPRKTAAYGEWARRLVDHAASDDLRRELPFWTSIREQACQLPMLPLDFPEGLNSEASAVRIIDSLTADETKRLLTVLPAELHASPHAILLTALVESVGKWIGLRKCHLETEGHGRQDLFNDVSVARTVGWFTSIYPCILDLTSSPDLRTSVRAAEDQLRSIPRRGIGYGMLRYLCRDHDPTAELAAFPKAQLNFNYLGQFDEQHGSQQTTLKPARERTGAVRDLSGLRSFPLYVLAIIEQHRLHVHWSYSRNLHREETIQKVSDDFMAVLRELLRVSDHDYGTAEHLDGAVLVHDDLRS